MNTTILLAAIALSSVGQCGPNGCAAGQNTSFSSQGRFFVPSYSMDCSSGTCKLQPNSYLAAVHVDGWDTKDYVVEGRIQVSKYKNNKQIGTWDCTLGCFRPFNEDTGVWGDPVYDVPQDLPDKYKPKNINVENKTQASSKIPDWMKDGVEMIPSKFTEDTYIIDGHPISEASFSGPDSTPVCPDTRDKKYLTAFVKDPGLREKVKKELQSSKFTDKCWVQTFGVDGKDAWRAEGHKLSESAKFAESGIAYFYQPPPDQNGFSKPYWAEYRYMLPEDIGRKIDKDFRPDDVPNSTPSLPSLPFGGGDENLPVYLFGAGAVLLVFMSPKPKAE